MVRARELHDDPSPGAFPAGASQAHIRPQLQRPFQVRSHALTIGALMKVPTNPLGFASCKGGFNRISDTLHSCLDFATDGEPVCEVRE